MEIVKLMKTVYVFKKKLVAILKEQPDETLKVVSCSMKLEDLGEFLKSNGYKVA